MDKLDIVSAFVWQKVRYENRVDDPKKVGQLPGAELGKHIGFIRQHDLFS